MTYILAALLCLPGTDDCVLETVTVRPGRCGLLSDWCSRYAYVRMHDIARGYTPTTVAEVRGEVACAEAGE